MTKSKISFLFLSLLLLPCLFFMTACNKEVKFDLTFVVDGENYYTISTSGNEVISMPQDPGKDDYEFDGWYWDNNVWEKPFTMNSLLDAPLSSNMCVYAKFNQIPAQTYVYWKNWDGTVLQQEETQSSNRVYKGDTPTKQGDEQYSYTFNGWIMSDYDGNIVYTAQYRQSINKYIVTFKNFDNSVLLTTDVYYGSPAQYTGPNPLRDDEEHYSYVFKGWDKSYSNVIEDLDVYAQYTEFTKYKFIYSSGDEKIVRIESSESVVNHYPANTQIAIIDMVKYYYEGWISVDNFSFIENIRMVPLYSVSYYLKTESSLPEHISVIEEGDNVILDSPTKTGYNFVGWYTSSAYENIINEIININENYNLYAKFEPIVYLISYYLDGGSNDSNNPHTCTYEDIITLKDAIKTGYEFNGWYLDVNYTNCISKIQKPTSDLNLYAKYIPCIYNLTLNANEGTFKNKVTFYYNHPPISLNGYVDMTYEQLEFETNEKVSPIILPSFRQNSVEFIFIGWCLSRHPTINYGSHELEEYPTYNDFYMFEEPLTQDINLYASWSCVNDDYSVDGGGTFRYNEHFLLSENVNYNEYYSQTKYIHVNTKNKTLAMKIDFDMTNAGSGYILTISSSSQGVIFSGRKCSDNFVINCSYGDVIIIKGTFGGGKISIDFLNVDLSEMSTVCNASSIKKYRVTYDALVDISTPVREGYEFLKWVDEDGQDIDINIPWRYDKDMVLLAKWRENE